MSASERLAQAEAEARRRAGAATNAVRQEQLQAAHEEQERRQRAKRGPTRPELGRVFARRAREAGIEPDRLTHRYEEPGEVVRMDAWLVPTRGLTTKLLYVTTTGGVFVGAARELLTAPWEHDASALRDDQLEMLLAEFLVAHEPRPAEPTPLTPSGLWKAGTEGALDGLLLGTVPILLIGILGWIDVANVLVWLFPIGGSIVGLGYAVWRARAASEEELPSAPETTPS